MYRCVLCTLLSRYLLLLVTGGETKMILGVVGLVDGA